MENPASLSEGCRRQQWGRPGEKLPIDTVLGIPRHLDMGRELPHHARARESVPAQSDAIAVLHITPLILQGLEIHRSGWRWRSRSSVDKGRGGVRLLRTSQGAVRLESDFSKAQTKERRSLTQFPGSKPRMTRDRTQRWS